MSIGEPVIRQDGRAKVTGRAEYTDDKAVFGLLEARYLRSGIANGLVTKIDISKAKDLPGVIDIFTFEDVPKIKFATSGHPYSLDPEHADTADRLLLTDRVRFIGDEIAVVVAEDSTTAAKAVELIDVEYDVYEPLTTIDKALDENAREIHEGSNNIVKQHKIRIGDEPQTALMDCDGEVTDTFHTQVVQHCHIENHATYAYMDDLDKITIVSSTQIPHIARRIISEALGFPLGRIRVIKPFVGGGFGGKQDVILEAMAAFLTLKLDGKPVRLAFDREECMIGTRTRHSFRIDGRIGYTNNGKARFIALDAVSNTGAYASHGHSVVSAGCAKVHSMYPRSDYSCRARTIYSNLPVAGAMRAYGSPQITFAIESLMDDAARKLKIDPLDFRLMNVANEGDLNRMSGKILQSCGLVECLKKGRDLIHWDEKKAEIINGQTGSVRRGLGVACFSYNSGTYPVCMEIAGARLSLNQDGSVHIMIGATEIGQGSDTAFVQMAAQTIGIDPNRITAISTQDTDVSPFDTGSYASRQVYVGSQAAYKASLQFKDKILEHAALMLDSDPKLLDIIDEEIVTKDGHNRLAGLDKVAMDSYYHKERGGQITAEVSYKTNTNAPVFGCTFVDIELDIPMCRIKINEIYNLHDSGRIINPVNARGQVEGGMAMGIGAAVFEELIIDENSGQVYNNNLLDYKLPTTMDIPDLNTGFIETKEPTNPYGSKSLGEPPVISPPPALRNAVLDACGVAVNELPLSPKNLFRHFKNAGLI